MIDPKALLQKEQTYTPTVGAITFACAITGLTIYLFDGHSVWLQWSLLFHLTSGIVCSIALFPYIVVHFQRTVGLRRTSVLISGLLTILLYLCFLYTGWHLMLYGQQENARWVYTVHTLSAALFFLIVLIHLVLHVKLLPEKFKNQHQTSFPSLPPSTLNIFLKVNYGILFLLIIFTATYLLTQEAFQPSFSNTEGDNKISSYRITNSHRCLTCHEEIGKQWWSSAHQQSATDPAYRSNLKHLVDKQDGTDPAYCKSCHAPDTLPVNERSDTASSIPVNHEGISCLSCHSINTVAHSKGTASFTFKPVEEYLFSQSTNPILMRIHDWLIRTKPDQHKKDLGKTILQDPKFCSACHTQSVNNDSDNLDRVILQDEYTAWLDSPYSKQHTEDLSNNGSNRCQDCHMPLVNAPDPSADENNNIRSHHFPGANTFLPLLRNDQKQFAATKAFLQSNKLKVSIDKPNRRDAIQTRHALTEDLRSFDEAPYYFYLGEKADIYTVISNRGVGHDFPGGTIDINQAWVEFLVMDAEGSLVYDSGLVDENNVVDSDAYFYRSLPIDHKGDPVWMHDQHSIGSESFRQVIKAGESDIVLNSFVIPAWAKSPLTITSTLKYRKLNDRYARWALKDQYFEIPIIDIAWDSLDIPIKIHKEVE